MRYTSPVRQLFFQRNNKYKELKQFFIHTQIIFVLRYFVSNQCVHFLIKLEKKQSSQKMMMTQEKYKKGKGIVYGSTGKELWKHGAWNE